MRVEGEERKAVRMNLKKRIERLYGHKQLLLLVVLLLNLKKRIERHDCVGDVGE